MACQQLCGRIAACLISLVVAVASAPADEPKEKSSPPTALQIAQWIKDLDSDDFDARKKAATQLVAAGKRAAGQVGKAAEGDSAEVTARCLDILAKLLQSTDAETKAEAKKALESLAKGKNPAAARQADALLNPGKVAGSPPEGAFGGAGPGIGGPGGVPPGVDPPGIGPPGGGLPGFGPPGIGPGGIFGGAAPGLRISVKTVDGNKTIEAEEGGKKTKIEVSAKGEIKMEVTETVDGKEKVSKYEAKNAEELKKNHPEAHKLYEKYNTTPGGLRIGIFGPGGPGGIGGGAPGGPGGIGPGGVPAPGGFGPGAPLPGGFGPGGAAAAGPVRFGPIPQKALDQMEEAKKQLAEATEKLRKLAGESRISPEEVKKLADQIEAAKKKLEEARAMLPK